MIIKLTQTKINIWVNVNHITYMHMNKKGTNIFVLECEYPIEVMETPDEIMELIKNA
jgi:hypothetical protein